VGDSRTELLKMVSNMWNRYKEVGTIGNILDIIYTADANAVRRRRRGKVKVKLSL